MQAELFQGKKTGHTISKFGMDESVVANFIPKLPNHCEYRLFFDNLFTSLPLLEYLSTKNIGGTVTIRSNRVGKTRPSYLNIVQRKKCQEALTSMHMLCT